MPADHFTVDTRLLPLFLTEPLYLIDAPIAEAQAIVAPQPIPALPNDAPVAAAKRSPPPSGPPAPPQPKNGGLAVLIHADGPLSEAHADMIAKIAASTAISIELTSIYATPMDAFAWPARWALWPARLTLLVGWPEALRANQLIGLAYTPVNFGTATFIAVDAPSALFESRELKLKLWEAIKSWKG